MRFGIVGLGRIGGALAEQALEKGHQVVVYNRTSSVTDTYAGKGADPAYSYEELAGKLPTPRVVMTYVPHGKATDAVIKDLKEALEPGDIIVDGGNSHWEDSKRRYADLKEDDIGFVDCGTSGGVIGARTGACFMVGGETEHVRLVAPLLRDLAVDGGFLHAGPPGSGHFVKLIHNAIEFGMVQSIAEGVDMLARSEYDLDLADVMHVYGNGSVIRSWLVDLMEKGLREEPDLDALSPHVEDTQEGKWYVRYALEREAYAPLLTLAEMMFYRYREHDSVSAKAVALMRHGFGEHPVHRKGDDADREARLTAQTPEWTP